MPIPAGPGGQREAWRGPGAAAGLFWRPVTLAQIPPRPQECRSLPSPPAPAPHPAPFGRARAERQSERGSQRASEGAGDGQDCSMPRRAPHAPHGQTPGQVRRGAGRGRRRRAEVRPSAGRRLAGAPRPTSTRTLTHTHSQLTRGQGDKDTHGAQETRGAPTPTRGGVLEGEGGAGPSRSTESAWGTRRRPGCPTAERERADSLNG